MTVQFENLYVKAPVAYNVFLTSMFGNYIELPLENKRKSTHDIICWYK